MGGEGRGGAGRKEVRGGRGGSLVIYGIACWLIYIASGDNARLFCGVKLTPKVE